MQKMLLQGLDIDLVQKKMRNIYIRIYAGGKIKVTAPLRIAVSDIEKFIVSKIDWIKSRQEKLKNHQPEFLKKVKPKYLDGENHYFFGKEYQLQIVENEGKTRVLLDGNFIKIYVRKNSTIKKRRKIFLEWQRAKIKELAPFYIAELEKKMGVKVANFGVKLMKTRWGTCNIKDRRIWLNLELAKKPLICLEYIITHEMVHLLERNHTKKFYAYMDQFMPSWKECKKLLAVH